MFKSFEHDVWTNLYSHVQWLKFGRKVLLHILCRDPDAFIRLPTSDEVIFYQSAIGNKYPNITEVWATADGLQLFIQAVGKGNEQNKYYNGYTHGHYINSVFVFSPNKKNRICLLNMPGNFHDSTMAGYGIYEGMGKVYNDAGGKFVVDLVFNLGSHDFLIKYSQQDPMDHNALLINREAISSW